MTTRRINLLPPELAQRRTARQRLAMVVAASVALVVALAAAFGVQQLRLSGVRSELAAEHDRNADLRAQKADLADFEKLQSELKRKTDLVTTLTQAEVRWSVILADISLVIPEETWLTNFTANVNQGASTGAAGSEAVLGQIQMNGATFTHLDVARWLTRLSQAEVFTFPYLSLSSKGGSDEGAVTFNSTVQLSEKALRRNQNGAVRRL